MKPQGTRIQTCSFAAETGKKYAIVPFTGQKGEEGSYTLTFQFEALPKHILLDKKYKNSCSIT